MGSLRTNSCANRAQSAPPELLANMRQMGADMVTKRTWDIGGQPWPERVVDHAPARPAVEEAGQQVQGVAGRPSVQTLLARQVLTRPSKRGHRQCGPGETEQMRVVRRRPVHD